MDVQIIPVRYGELASGVRVGRLAKGQGVKKPALPGLGGMIHVGGRGLIGLSL